MAKRQNRCGLQAGIHMIPFIVDQISDRVAESSSLTSPPFF